MSSDLPYLFAGLAIALLASHHALELVRWARKQPWHTQRYRILAAGLSLGAGGSALHILAFMAMGEQYRADWAITFLAFLAGTVGPWAGLAVAYWSPSPRGRTAGGVLMAAGATAMHFGAVAAMNPPMTYRSLPLVGLAIAFDLVFSCAAMNVALPASGSDQATSGASMLLGPVLLTVGRLGLHFTALAATDQCFLQVLTRGITDANAVPTSAYLVGVDMVAIVAIAMASAYWKQQANHEVTLLHERMSPLFFVVDANGRFTYVNRTLAECAPERSLIGANIWKEFGAYLTPALHDQYQAVVRDHVQVRFQAHLPKSDRWYDILAYPSGRGIAVCLYDIDDQKRAEAVLREHAVREERGRAQTRLLQLAAHELRNPMAGVKGILSLMRRRIAMGRPPGDLAQLTGTMEREIDRLSVLLDQVFEAFRRETGRLEMLEEPVDLVPVVIASLQPFVFASDNHHFLTDGLSAGPVWVKGDPQRLEDVVRNLLHNAVKYSPEGGEVRVQLACAHGNVRLSVSDQGFGIPPKQLERIFEGFFRGSNLAGRDPGGLGLGLHLCRDTVQRHGGRIWAESVEGSGATFHVELPQADGLS